MTLVTRQERQQQLNRLAQTPMEREAARLLRLGGVTDDRRESLSSLLSLMIWGARQREDEETADLLLRMEAIRGPLGTLKAALGKENVAEQMAEMGPQEAADELLAIAGDQLFA